MVPKIFADEFLVRIANLKGRTRKIYETIAENLLKIADEEGNFINFPVDYKFSY